MTINWNNGYTDDPVEKHYRAVLQLAAAAINSILHGGKQEATDGFFLMVFPLGPGSPNNNYMTSNLKREEFVRFLQEQLAPLLDKLAKEQGK